MSCEKFQRAHALQNNMKKGIQLDNDCETFRRVVHKKVPSDFNKLTDKTARFLGIVYQFCVRNMVVVIIVHSKCGDLQFLVSLEFSITPYWIRGRFDPI